jgi:hypothetical protein
MPMNGHMTIELNTVRDGFWIVSLNPQNSDG